jgi:restriction system protein
MTFMGYYFYPDAIASINATASDEERHRGESDARVAEDLQEAGHNAALAGNLESIVVLSPTDFEFTMAAYLRMLGMSEIQRVGGRGHFGVEIVARDASGHSVLVRCTRRSGAKKIGLPEIRAFLGTAHMHHRSELRLFVTTSAYTEHARTLAFQHGVQLLDGSDLHDLARRQRSQLPHIESPGT